MAQNGGERYGVQVLLQPRAVLGALASLSADDLASLREEKKDIEVRCQFCDAVYNFTPEEIAALNAPEEDKKA